MTPRRARPNSPPRVELITDEQALSWASDDWGHLVKRTPRGVLRPGSVAEIAAAAREFPLVPRGQGHSLAGQAQSDGGVVVDMSGLAEIHRVDYDRVSVGAGACWSQVLRVTLQHGLTPPVLTDYIELSVGGTVSVGGIGGTTNRHGMQTDTVLELDAITPDGALHTCSATRNPALFDALRAGRGRHGIIVRATIRLVPAHAYARRQLLRYRDLAAFLADQRRLAADGRFHYLEGQAQPAEDGTWEYYIEVVTFHSVAALDTSPLLRDLDHDAEEVEDLTCFDFLNRMAPTEVELREAGLWYHPHPWIDVFLPDSAADEVIGETMRNLGVADVGDGGVVLIYPFRTGRIGTPGLALPDEPVSFLLALLRTAPPDDPVALNSMLEANQRLRERTHDVGGTVYLEH